MNASDRTCRVNPAAQRELSRLVNRHKSRILRQLEMSGCPRNFRSDVADGIDYMRSDLSRLNGSLMHEKQTTKENEGNENRAKTN